MFPRSDLHKNWSGGTLDHPKHAPTEISILVYLHLYHYGTRSLIYSIHHIHIISTCSPRTTVFDTTKDSFTGFGMQIKEIIIHNDSSTDPDNYNYDKDWIETDLLDSFG